MADIITDNLQAHNKKEEDNKRIIFNGVLALAEKAGIDERNFRDAYLQSLKDEALKNSPRPVAAPQAQPRPQLPKSKEQASTYDHRYDSVYDIILRNAQKIKNPTHRRIISNSIITLGKDFFNQHAQGAKVEAAEAAKKQTGVSSNQGPTVQQESASAQGSASTQQSVSKQESAPKQESSSNEQFDLDANDDFEEDADNLSNKQYTLTPDSGSTREEEWEETSDLSNGTEQNLVELNSELWFFMQRVGRNFAKAINEQLRNEGMNPSENEQIFKVGGSLLLDSGRQFGLSGVGIRHVNLITVSDNPCSLFNQNAGNLVIAAQLLGNLFSPKI